MATATTTARHLEIMHEIASRIRPEESRESAVARFSGPRTQHYRGLAVIIAAWHKATETPFGRADHDAITECYEQGYEAGFYVFDLLLEKNEELD